LSQTRELTPRQSIWSHRIATINAFSFIISCHGYEATIQRLRCRKCVCWSWM